MMVNQLKIVLPIGVLMFALVTHADALSCFKSCSGPCCKELNLEPDDPPYSSYIPASLFQEDCFTKSGDNDDKEGAETSEKCEGDGFFKCYKVDIEYEKGSNKKTLTYKGCDTSSSASIVFRSYSDIASGKAPYTEFLHGDGFTVDVYVDTCTTDDCNSGVGLKISISAICALLLIHTLL